MLGFVIASVMIFDAIFECIFWVRLQFYLYFLINVVFCRFFFNFVSYHIIYNMCSFYWCRFDDGNGSSVGMRSVEWSRSWSRKPMAAWEQARLRVRQQRQRYKHQYLTTDKRFIFYLFSDLSTKLVG